MNHSLPINSKILVCRRRDKSALYGVIVLSATIPFLLILAFYCHKKHKYNLKNKHAIIIQRPNLNLGEEIGSGNFGIVYKGIYSENPRKIQTQQIVAIKLLKTIDKDQLTAFMSETNTWAMCEHDNLVKLVGICISDKPMLVSEFVDGGCLLPVVRGLREKEGHGSGSSQHNSSSMEPQRQESNREKEKEEIIFNNKHMLLWCYQIADGMLYLSRKNIVHRDLACRNILIKDAYKVKITDFGLSKLTEYTDMENRDNGQNVTSANQSNEPMTEESSLLEVQSRNSRIVVSNRLSKRASMINTNSNAMSMQAMSMQNANSSLNTSDTQQTLVNTTSLSNGNTTSLETPSSPTNKISTSSFMESQKYYKADAKEKMPLRWLAPEAWSDRTYTQMTDVWAYGVTLWEILHYGEIPYKEVKNLFSLPRMFKKGQVLEKPSMATQDFYDFVLVKCWEYKAEERISFEELAGILKTWVDRGDQDKYICKIKGIWFTWLCSCVKSRHMSISKGLHHSLPHEIPNRRTQKIQKVKSLQN